MKLNEPLTPEQQAQRDDEHRERILKQKEEIYKIAELIKAGKGGELDETQKGWAEKILQKHADRMSLKRKRATGRQAKVPEISIVTRQAYIAKGKSVTEAEALLAEEYGVDIETLQSRIKRLSKTEIAEAWGFAKWGAN